MYVHLRDLFAHLLGHSFENIVIDSPQESAGGNSPDLAIRSDTGLLDAKERIIYHDWIVVEAKVGKNIFRNPEHRERIFSDKQKYIRPETEWFVMIDPTCMVIRPIAARSQIDPNADKVFRWEEFTSADDFCNKLSDLHANSAADSPALTAFRLGDVSRIAVVKVDLPDEERAKLSAADRERLALARKDFLGVVRSGTEMLREAYKKGGEIYGETFDKTDLDWVLNCPSKFVSRAVEMMMLLLSRFDFSTISGDILTGIYDRFLDRGQRKAMGEFYTPPSVARYIVRRLNIRQTDSVFDPACGSVHFCWRPLSI